MLEWLGGPLGDMVHARASEAGARGRQAWQALAGNIGTSVRTWGGGSSACCYVRPCPTPTQQSKSVPRPAAWEVRGKPNELKRLDVPVSDPTSRAAARHQKRKCNSSRRQPVHFVQGWSIFCLLSITSEQQAVSSSAAVSAAAAVKQHHKDPIKTAPQTCPASTFTLLTRSTVKDISICLHCIVLHLHCVALCRSRLPVGQSRLLYFSDRYTLGAHLFYHSLPFPPSPIRVTTIHITLDAISRRNTTTSLLSSPATISLSLSPSPPRSFS